MTDVAVGRQGRDSRIRRVTSETYRVIHRSGFERSLLQPEVVVRQALRAGSHKLIIRFPLRHICLMTDGAALRLALLLRGCARYRERRVDKADALASPHKIRLIPANYVHVLIVRKVYAEIRDRVFPARRVLYKSREAGERKAHGVARADLEM